GGVATPLPRRRGPPLPRCGSPRPRRRRRPDHSPGEPLPRGTSGSSTDAMITPNIASHLPDMARRRPHRAAVVVPNGRDRAGRVRHDQYTFSQLDEESDHLAAGLRAIGLQRGTRTVLMLKPGLDFFALTFALFKAGLVPVLVDPGMGVRNLGRCLAE